MMQLWCAGIYHNHIIANCLQSVPVKEYAAVKGPPLRYSSWLGIWCFIIAVL